MRFSKASGTIDFQGAIVINPNDIAVRIDNDCFDLHISNVQIWNVRGRFIWKIKATWAALCMIWITAKQDGAAPKPGGTQ